MINKIIASKSSPLARGVAGGTRRGVAKKFIIAIMCVLGIATAYATGENERATSVGYVTEELTTRQDKFNKLGADTAMTYSGSTDGAVGSRAISGDLGNESNTTNTAIPTVGAVNTKLDNKQDELDFAANTVLMNTGTAGAPAAKGIYDDSGSFAEQSDSLIEAATFNAALQNAINSEFTCAQRKDPNDPTSKCLLFNIFAPVAPSRNLFDVSKIPDRTLGYYGTICENNGDGTITVTDAPPMDSAIYCGGTLGALAPGLIVNNTYTLSFDTNGTSRGIYLYKARQSWFSGQSKTITQEMLDSLVHFYAAYNGQTPSTATISNIQIELGTVATPYQPYGQNTFIPQNQ